MVVGEASIHNIMGGMMSTGGVRLHNHKRKLKQRFDIIKKLGQGTYGKVQLGINKETGQEVAIKTIKKCKIETEADLIRIRREIQIMSSVQHPNIIHIYEVFENREKMVLVMEYAAGGELYDYLSERKVLTEQEARRIFRQIATAVFYCHKHKICHRDLKLENILLDQVGNAKIADFGLSNVFDEQRLLNTFCGSPLYASPEIVKGTPYHGPEVDCWSLGVLLYTLVYGAMPFDGSNFKRLVKQISQSDYFEPKKPSPASPLIKDMLTVSPAKRAGIERICTHWWVNEGYEQNCLDIAEELAAQTPVRLDLLLSLVPQSASAEKLVVGDQRPAGDVPHNVSSETLVPTRCHSVGSLMELDRDNSDRRIRELLDEEPRSSPASGDAAKRKLETTPSMDETAAAGAKRKDRPKRKEKRDERESRAYKSAARHHSAPIPNSITEEAMEIEPIVTLPAVEVGKPAKSVDPDSTACLELISECNERSPSKERSKTPVIAERQQPILVECPRTSPPSEDPRSDDGHDREEKERPAKPLDEAASIVALEAARGFHQLDPVDQASSAAVGAKSTVALARVATADDRLENAMGMAGQATIDLEETRKEFKKLKEKALSLDSELSSPEPRDVAAKTFERRRSKIFETAEKFNQMTASVDNEKPKKIFIPGVNVGGAKRVFERKASLSSASVPPPLAKPIASKVIIDVSPSAPSVTSSVSSLEAARKDRTKRIGRNVDGTETADAEKQQQQQPEKVAEIEKKTKQQQQQQQQEEEEAAKKKAVDIITGAIGKPPVQKKINGSPPVSPPSQDSKRLPLKIPVGPNDTRSATVSVTTPIDTKFSFDENTERRGPLAAVVPARVADEEDVQPEEPKMSSKVEITLKSATLPRPRKTSKAEICLSGMKSTDAPVAFRSEVEAKIDAFQPQRLRTQRSEVAFPVAAAVPQANRSSSLEPDGVSRNVAPKERIIPIQIEAMEPRQSQHSATPPPPPSKPPPMPQRSVSQRSGSLSRQSTADSDTDSALGSAIGPEPIRKSPREYIIPIAVEGGGYVTPRAGSVEPEIKTGISSSTGSTGSGNAARSRFGRPRRMSSLLSDASEDESPFSSLHRDSEDLLQRHMHRLRSSRPSRQPPEHADSLSSGEDDDDDGFELLTAENLFSTLLSRVRSLTQRLNVDDNRTTGFPSSRLFGRLGGSTANSPQAFWGLNKPLSRRLSESQFRHSLSRDADLFSMKDSVNSSSNAGTLNSPGSHAASSRETMFDIGGSGGGGGSSSSSSSNSHTLPRDKIAREDAEAEPRIRIGAQESLEQSFTPSLARRLSRTLIEQTRRSLTRSPSVPQHDHRSRSAGREAVASWQDSAAVSTISDQTEYKERSCQPIGRAVRRSSSLLEPGSRGSPRRCAVGLFDDEDVDEAALDDDNGLARWYRDTSSSRYRRGDSFRSYRREKIQEETMDDASYAGPESRSECNADNGSMVSECTSASVCDSHTNLLDATTSSLSAKSYETSPTESSSNIGDHRIAAYKSDSSRNFENRLLAAENLIKESKLKNLGPRGCGGKFDPNLTTSYRDNAKSEKRSLLSIAEASGVGPRESMGANHADDGGSISAISKRRSCIPSLRLRSSSLSRDSSVSRRKSFADSRDAGSFATSGSLSPERSLLSKLFKVTGGSRENDGGEGRAEKESEKTQKSKHRRISRFLRPDFFDTPREESRYAKEKDAQKEAENERRKSRFIRRKTENKPISAASPNERREKELKNEINCLRRDQCSQEAEATTEVTTEVTIGSVDQSSRNGFLHSLEKKLERLRSTDDEQPDKEKAKRVEKRQRQSTLRDPIETKNGAGATVVDEVRERSAPPIDWPASTVVDQPTTIAKRSSSVEDLSTGRKTTTTTTTATTTTITGQSCSSRSRVSSVLGLFKSMDGKRLANGTRSQTAVANKPKRSPTKATKSGDASTDDSNAFGGGSKIPTKHVNTTDVKATKKKIGNGKGADKSTTMTTTNNKIAVSSASASVSSSASECSKRSPPKEKVESQSGSLPTKDASPLTEREKSDSVENVEAQEKTKKTKRALLANCPIVQSNDPNDSERKTKKTVKKVSETTENETDGAKRKKITRVVKKVVKKPNEGAASGDAEKSMTEEKEKSIKVKTTRKKIGGDANSISTCLPRNGKSKENGLEVRANGKGKSGSGGCPLTEDPAKFVDESVPGDARNGQRTPAVEHQRSNRSNLKLDLSKIPQHSFRNSTPKKESPKSSDSPKPLPTNDELIAKPTDKPADKPSDCPLKTVVAHEGKIAIEKPLRATDVAELRKGVTECARIIESQATAGAAIPTLPTIAAATASAMNRCASCISKEPPAADYANELLSPMDEPESFDSWSISSAELCHARADLPSPTSPSHSLPAKSDAAESVIDRIRRRSFYSRFNDRRRPSLTAPPPGVALPSSATLPRKFSLTGAHREHRDRGKYIIPGYGLTTGSKPDRSHGLYTGDDQVLRNRSLDRGLYSDCEHATSLASSYDPLRKYLRSPTFDLSASRSRFHSADFATEPDLFAGYRPPLSTLLSDAAAESRVTSSLPRKYGSGVRRPKTVEYYEELLTPSCPEYMPVRRAAASIDYPNKSENGYYHGNLELRSSVIGMRKPYATEHPASLDLSERRGTVSNVAACDDDAFERSRGTAERSIETRPSSSSSTSAEGTTTTAGNRVTDCG